MLAENIREGNTMRAFIASTAALLILASAAQAQAPAKKDGYFTADDGVKLHYVTLGAKGSWVVLMHGYTADADQNWFANGIAQELAKTHRVLAFDARGHGLSDKPHDPSKYATDRFPEDAFELMDSLHIQKAHIAGYSMGGNMLRLMIAMHPERIITASFGGSGIPDPDPAKAKADAALSPKCADPAEAQASKELQALKTRDSEALADVRKGRDAAPTKTQPVNAATIRFPMQFANGECNNGASAGAYAKRASKGPVDIEIFKGKSHLTTVFDPEYREALVKFINSHDKA